MPAATDFDFPPGFYWGAATSAYQIEGAANEGGRGESIWDSFCHTTGKIANGDTADVACDHYHRYREDVALMASLGLNAYRFSVAWPRIIPNGTGTVNEEGLDFYDRLVDELLQHDIEPFLTLYHWDLPVPLQKQGGWTSRHSVDAFVRYAEVVANRLGDRVKTWTTHNEPWVLAWAGYGEAAHPPELRGDGNALRAAHNLLLSHGRAVDAIRETVPGARVGISLNLIPVYPESPSTVDEQAARLSDGMHNRWFLDPIFRAEYPADMLELFGENAPRSEPDDMSYISRPLDFLGVNYYMRKVVKADPSGGQPMGIVVEPKGEYTDVGWEAYPAGFTDLLVRVHRDYDPPRIYITENGAAFTDTVSPYGHVHDAARTRYLQTHLEAIQHAMEDGTMLHGYFVWSLLDNFEWGHGYSKRFGLVYVDYPTQTRITKDSGEWYRQYIREHQPSPVAP